MPRAQVGQPERITTSQEWLDKLAVDRQIVEMRRNRLRGEMAHLETLIAQQAGAVALMIELVGGEREG